MPTFRHGAFRFQNRRLTKVTYEQHTDGISKYYRQGLRPCFALSRQIAPGLQLLQLPRELPTHVRALAILPSTESLSALPRQPLILRYLPKEGGEFMRESQRLESDFFSLRLRPLVRGRRVLRSSRPYQSNGCGDKEPNA